MLYQVRRRFSIISEPTVVVKGLALWSDPRMAESRPLVLFMSKPVVLNGEHFQATPSRDISADFRSIHHRHWFSSLRHDRGAKSRRVRIIATVGGGVVKDLTPWIMMFRWSVLREIID